MKLLVVDLQSPNETHYHDPNTIGAFLLGRRLSNYPMFAVKDDGTMKKIVVDSADVTEIEKQVLEQLNDTPDPYYINLTNAYLNIFKKEFFELYGNNGADELIERAFGSGCEVGEGIARSEFTKLLTEYKNIMGNLK